MLEYFEPEERKALTRIILIRHGQTEWNRAEKFRGRADLALDETGVRQAKAAAERIANWPVSAFYTSPLKRALMTTQILASPFNLPVQPLSGLLDIDYGRWQGLSPEEAAAQDRNLFARWLEYPHQVQFPEGESLQDVRSRAVAALDSVLEDHKDKTVVLVSHMVVCRVLLCAVLGLDNSHFWQVAQDVCAINILEEKDGALVVTLTNDTCHLKNLTR